MLSENEKTLAGKIAKFILVLLAFLGIQSVTEAMQEIAKAEADVDPTVKPTVLQLGDSLFDVFIAAEPLVPAEKEPVYAKWVTIVKTGFDAIEGGAGAVIAYFEAVIAGHKAKVAAEKSATPAE